MKKFTKLFLLALCSGFLFLGFSNAQSGFQENSYITGDDTTINTNNSNINENVNSVSGSLNPLREESIYFTDHQTCTCGMNGLSLFVWIFLRGIEILLGIMLIIISLKTISLCKNPKSTYKHNRLFCLPGINLYPLSKITIGKIRFFILILLLGFFVYNIYEYKIFLYNDLCCNNPIRQGYAGIIVGFYSIVILVVLLSKLSHLAKSSQKNSDKEPSNK